jgi:hypothetical protein
MELKKMNVELLRAIANANAANSVVYVSPADGMELYKAGFITVDSTKIDPNDATKVAANVTEAGVNQLSALNGATVAHTKPVHTYDVQTGGLELPKIKRGFGKGGGGGAPTKYPFETMEVGAWFFVANSEVSKGNAHKTMGSAVGSANQRFAVGTGEQETVERVKRGPDHKAIKDANGKNVKETVTQEKKKFTKKFVVRAVEAGKVYGTFTAPSDGAVIQRET